MPASAPAQGPSLVLVDDDPVTGVVLQRQCARAGYRCRVYQEAQLALEAFGTEGADLLVTDLRMPHMNGFDFLARVRELDPEVPILVMTGYSSIETAVEAMKRGANDFIKKPFNFEELNLMIERTLQAQKLKRENLMLKAQVERGAERFDMIGSSPAMLQLFQTIDKVAPIPCNVIITGQSGTGKELVARALHEHGPRPDAPFVVIDCGALPDSLLESELFGHERGAFTGASQRKRGLMEQASGGTLFLDEIGNISDTMQMKLMRAIEEQRITRVGATEPVTIDLRIIAASNKDLAGLVARGEFRHDFYHRLNVVGIHVPSLTERREDIPVLVAHFVADYARRYNRAVQGFDRDSLERLCAQSWPGNVRELRNAVERCVILAEGPTLSWPQGTLGDPPKGAGHIVFPEDNFPSLDEIERQYIEHILERAGGKKTRAARILDIDKTTLWRKLRRAQPDP